MTARGRPRSYDREEALHQAMRVFWSKGFENASLSDLTAAMGLNPPSLYAAFGCKEALFQEAVELYSRTEGNGIWNLIADAPSAREAVAHVLRKSAEAFTRRSLPRGCMIVLAAPQAEGPNEAICNELKRRRRENIAQLEHRFKQAVAQGELPEGSDCRALAGYVTSLQLGMSIQARDGATRKSLRKVADCGLASWDCLVSTGQG